MSDEFTSKSFDPQTRFYGTALNRRAQQPTNDFHPGHNQFIVKSGASHENSNIASTLRQSHELGHGDH